MVNPVTQATQAQPVAEVSAKPQAKAAQAKPEAAATADTVQLSAAAQSQLAAVKELRETPAQTAKEANSGDRQAKNLLAKETAHKPSAK